MEEKVYESTETDPSPKPRKDAYSWFGRIALILLVLAFLIGGGYYLGRFDKEPDQTMSPNPQPTQAVMMQGTPETSPTATKTALEIKTVTAGGAKGTSFSQYIIEIPEGWNEKHEVTDITDKLTVTQGKYSLSIYQAPMGGGGCLYPGDPDSQMAQRFTDFGGIDGNSGNFRRSWNKTGNPVGMISYTYCQRGDDGSFGNPTSFGAISATSPDPSEKDIIIDMNTMVSSLTKK